MKYILMLASCVFMMMSCNNQNTKQKEANSEGNTSTTVDVSAKESSSQAINYPSLTDDIVKNLGMNCDYVDYIFYDLPISISQDNKQAIVSNINFISKEVPTSIQDACKPMGRKFFHVNGEIILEADIYLNKEEGCFFYIFYEDGKKAYANKIARDGVNFYFNVFSQAGIKK